VKDARAIAALLIADKDFAKSRNRPTVHPLALELVELKSREVNEQLVAALPTSDPAIRASIIFVLSQENDASLAALLMPYLDDAETTVRAQVAKWIGRSRDASRVDELLEALARETSDGHVDAGEVEAMLAQIAALGELKDRRATGPLRELREKTKDGRVTAAVEEALSKM
jgi:HEAT repeat protein